MQPKVIQNQAEYEAALAHLESLMDAAPGSQQERELELFALLVETFEKEHFPIPLPDPIAAITFRMQQQGLTRKDMRRYLGSQSKVSEVLSGKRPLSLAMVRKLHNELGIPAEVLLQESGRSLPGAACRWQDFPFQEMFHQGYFPAFRGSLAQAKEQAEELLGGLLAPFAGQPPQLLYCKHADQPINASALLAWQARVLALVEGEQLPAFERQSLDDDLLEKLVHLSYYDSGPQLVREHLNKKGIHFIIHPHLPRTYLDGAAFLTRSSRPVIGLTLRHDRLDHFWFTLMHELAHVYLHLRDTQIAFFDETIHNGAAEQDQREREANTFARNALVPPVYWQTHCQPNLDTFSKAQIVYHAGQLEISPAILAGRLRWETRNYSKYGELVGHHQVREQFSEYQVKRDQS